ncbi:NnrU family protein [Sulfurimonas sp. HSL1-2]|uniref:methyltransferase family protein n=1 Tax=Thiomicrolovo zhangzhouensis TaxID=3131933 RepID=UPI0031F89D62
MQQILLFIYALFAYLSAMVSVSLLILWVYPWSFMPFTIDSGKSGSFALVINLALIALFGLQHSVMARTAVKQVLFGALPVAFRTSTYTVLSALCLLLIILLWQPMTGTVYAFETGPLFWAATLLYVLGWSMAFVATFQIDHFELFGLHQGYRALRGIPEPEVRFQKKGFYRYVRHPIQTGTVIGLWATPVMSTGHLLFSTGMTLYILIGLVFEEKDLVKTLGEAYRRYREEVPMLLPFGKKRA